MKTFILLFVCVCSGIFLCAQPNPKLVITHLTGDFYVYMTYNTYKGKPMPANSMYLLTDQGVVMLDMPWDSTQFQPLLDSIEARHHQKVVMSLSTHFHADRTDANDFLKAKGIATYSSKLTYDLCAEHHEHQAAHTFENDTAFRIGNYVFETFYPGQGHTADNIVVLFDKDKVLYGGCFIKSTEAKDLGNITDANIKAWPESIRKLQKKFPHPKYIMPGHDSWTNGRSLEHTLMLLKRKKV